MHHTTLGRTGLTVSVAGLGTGGLFVEETQGIAAGWDHVMAALGLVRPHDTLRDYNTYVLQFPNSIYAGWAGYKQNPAYFQAMKDAVARCGLEGRVIFTGELPHRAVEALLSGCESFVFTSTCENCPTALIEAMSFGLLESPGAQGAGLSATSCRRSTRRWACRRPAASSLPSARAW